MRLRQAWVLVCASIGLIASGAVWAAEDGFYIGAAGGGNFPRDTDFEITGINPEAEYDAGLAGVAALGYGFGNGFRVEGEFGYRDNDVDNVAGVNASGDVTATTVIGNILYDIDLGGRLTPYLGLGAGGANIDFDSVSPVAGSAVDDDDTTFAVQGIVGAAVDVTDRLKLTVDYRYLDAPTVEVRTNGGADAETSYRSHSVMVGLRFSFGAPRRVEPIQAPAEPEPAAAPKPAPPTAPAPAVTAPAPPAVRNFLVFFDWDRADITPEALSIIESAAETARTIAPVRIEVTGHADRSGPRNYNQGLSQRRAEAVRGELMRLGIAESDIGVFARGEDDPLLLTPDGVREPQNRRVEIVLQ